MALLFLLGACEIFSPGDDGPHELWISDTGLVLQPGETFAFGALVQERGTSGSRPGSEHLPPDVARWWSDDPAVVAVPDEASGAMEAGAPGETVVWVEVGTRRDSATVTVRAPDADGPSRRWRDVSTWMTTTCGLDESGTAYCWGSNAMGELGNGPRRFNTHTHRPVRVSAPGSFVQIEVGTTFACARTGAGEIWCWGVHLGSRLGHARTSVDFEEEPVRVDFDGRATALAVGSQHACLLDEDGRAHCWGSNLGYQLGIEESVTSSAALGGRTVPVAFDGSFVELASAAYNTCGITEASELYCWGLVSGGANGIGREAPTPVQIDTPVSPVQVAPGDGGSCYLDAEGGVYCWGLLRLATSGQVQTPVKAELDLRFSELGGPCGIDLQGGMWCWGLEGRLDPAEATEPCNPGAPEMCSPDPVRVSDELAFRKLSVGIAACGITTTDELYCWGRNNWAQLGIGRPQVEQTHIPQRVLDPL